MRAVRMVGCELLWWMVYLAALVAGGAAGEALCAIPWGRDPVWAVLVCVLAAMGVLCVGSFLGRSRFRVNLWDA